MKMSVRERDIRHFVSLLGYDSLLFHFVFFLFTMSWGKGLKRFYDNSPRLAWWYIFVSVSPSTETFLLKRLKSNDENPWDVTNSQLKTFQKIESSTFLTCNLIVTSVVTIKFSCNSHKSWSSTSMSLKYSYQKLMLHFNEKYLNNILSAGALRNVALMMMILTMPFR